MTTTYDANGSTSLEQPYNTSRGLEAIIGDKGIDALVDIFDNNGDGEVSPLLQSILDAYDSYKEEDSDLERGAGILTKAAYMAWWWKQYDALIQGPLGTYIDEIQNAFTEKNTDGLNKSQKVIYSILNKYATDETGDIKPKINKLLDAFDRDREEDSATQKGLYKIGQVFWGITGLLMYNGIMNYIVEPTLDSIQKELAERRKQYES